MSTKVFCQQYEHFNTELDDVTTDNISHTGYASSLSSSQTHNVRYTVKNRRDIKTQVFKKKPNPVGFLDKQEKTGEIIQKLSNLKP